MTEPRPVTLPAYRLGDLPRDGTWQYESPDTGVWITLRGTRDAWRYALNTLVHARPAPLEPPGVVAAVAASMRHEVRLTTFGELAARNDLTQWEYAGTLTPKWFPTENLVRRAHQGAENHPVLVRRRER